MSQPRLTPCVLLNLSFCGLYEKVNWPGLPRSWFVEWIFRQAGQPTFSYKPQNGKKYASFSIYRNWFCGLTTRLQNSRFFFSKSVMKSVKRGVIVYGRVRREKKNVSPESRSLTFCLTARAYLNTQKYGLFCSLAYNSYNWPTDVTAAILDEKPSLGTTQFFM